MPTAEPFTLQTLPWHGWVLLSVMLLLFIAAVLWLAWLGRKPRMPEGHQHEAWFGGYKATTIVRKNALTAGAALSKETAIAVWAAGEAWREVMEETPTIAKDVVVYYTDGEYFDNQPWKEVANAAAFLVRTSAPVGNAGVPMAVVRASLADLVVETGEPVIHEVLHALLGAYTERDVDRDHSHILVWAANGGVIQVLARQKFKEML